MSDPSSPYAMQRLIALKDDWFEAELAVYKSLVASGTIPASPNDPQNIRKVIDRWIYGNSGR
jgi:hypothetical protein